jgi:hypothetical protein
VELGRGLALFGFTGAMPPSVLEIVSCLLSEGSSGSRFEHANLCHALTDLPTALVEPFTRRDDAVLRSLAYQVLAARGSEVPRAVPVDLFELDASFEREGDEGLRRVLADSNRLFASRVVSYAAEHRRCDLVDLIA